MKNKENIKKAVEKFCEVRDLPWHIAIHPNEKMQNCYSKNLDLSETLKKLGYKTRARICYFKWEELGLPEEIMRIDHEEKPMHLYLEVMPATREDWVSVDATWNKELGRTGFKIADWDGKKATILAVKPINIMSPEKSERYIAKIRKKNDKCVPYNKFADKFNKYCDSFLRKVEIQDKEYSILAEGTYVTKSESDMPYKKYKLNDKKVLVVSEKEDFAYFGEDLGDLGIEPGAKAVHYKDKEFRLNTTDSQILKNVEFGNPESNVNFWDYEAVDDKDYLISIGLDEKTGKRSDVVGRIVSKRDINFIDSRFRSSSLSDELTSESNDGNDRG